MVGRFVHGQGQFYDQEEFEGRVIMTRNGFSAITANSSHFEQAFSSRIIAWVAIMRSVILTRNDQECPDMLPMSTVTRPFLTILALLTLTAPCLAFVGPQYTFGRHDFQTGAFPSGVVVADVNGDGKEDVIVANQLDNTVSVFLGQPNGIFGARQNFPTAAGPVALVVADFNHDGKLDLAVVASSANVVSVLLGKGNGTFRPAVNYPTGQGPYALAAPSGHLSGFSHHGRFQWGRDPRRRGRSGGFRRNG
jgi:hypothetical protein